MDQGKRKAKEIEFQGMFITFEGIEGCGKSTQIDLLADFLDTKGLSRVVTREPGGTGIGEKVREILLSSQNSGMKPMAELFLIMACRAQHVDEVIKPALMNKKIVLCDRFSDATVAYQAYARGIDLKSVKQLNQMASSGLKPDVTILLDCHVDVGLTRAMKRIHSRTNHPREDRFEREEKIFHEKVREGYLEIARAEENRYIVIDGSKDINTIHKEICEAIYPRIKRNTS
ncbi:MAG: dTMP kinase [Thermodesulfobacteriota bacterium]|nr:dTMP kinase [Thermodesulfobacteriota bacterium]